MAEDKYQHTVDGQEVQEKDFNLFAAEAALADDRVLAELLRMAPFDGTTVARAVIPYAVSNGAAAQPMVAPNGASGSVKVRPFRAVVGSRTAVSSTPGTPLANWRDIRSKVYSPSDDNATLGHAVTFAGNSSGHPRWDLLYVEVDVDQNSPNEDRNVRAPGTPATTPATSTSLVVTKTQIVSVNVVTGTASASPTIPAIPADIPGAAGSFYIQIAAVRIPDSFSGTSIVGPDDILMLAPIVPMSAAFGAVSGRPAGRMAAKIASAAIQTWGASGTRPKAAMPSTMTGGLQLHFAIDASVVTPLIVDAGIVDDDIDWRKRYFRVDGFTKGSVTQFAWEPGAVAGATMPQAGTPVSSRQIGHSFFDDSATFLGSSRNAGMVWYADHSTMSTIASGSNAIGLYVDLSSGALKLFYLGTPGVQIVFWIDATGIYDNP